MKAMIAIVPRAKRAKLTWVAARLANKPVLTESTLVLVKLPHSAAAQAAQTERLERIERPKRRKTRRNLKRWLP